MEFLNGGDLYSLLRNLGCLDEDMARVYIAEVVGILAFIFCSFIMWWISVICFLFCLIFSLSSAGTCLGVFAFLKYNSQRLEAR